MAIFPRRIGGRYAMLSRQDDENLFLMFSDNPHFWSDPQLLRRPCHAWEGVLDHVPGQLLFPERPCDLEVAADPFHHIRAAVHVQVIAAADEFPGSF
jgi:hypothetical protein